MVDKDFDDDDLDFLIRPHEKRLWEEMESKRVRSKQDPTIVIKSLESERKQYLLDFSETPTPYKDLYVIQEDDQNIYKIGISGDPYRRLKRLQQGTSHKLKLKFILKEGGFFEHVLKIYLSRFQIRGEWFELENDDLWDVILELVKYNIDYSKYKEVLKNYYDKINEINLLREEIIKSRERYDQLIDDLFE